jgi:general secretion pathway protein C
MTGISLHSNDLARLLQGRNAQLSIRLVNLLLVVWIAAQLATLTWALFPRQEQAAAPAVTQSKPSPQSSPQSALVEQLPEMHLMGVPTQEASAIANASVNAPDTQLQLTLHGALASDDKEQARAIIAEPGGKEDQYAIGDTVPGNAELSEIYPDRVILKRSGRFETLRLPVDNGPAGSAPRSLSAVVGAAATPSERLRQVREQIQNNPRSMYGMIRATPQVDEDGNISGYAVAPGQDPRLFSQVGLQDGDVVTEVNGMSMSDPANSAKALKSLQGGEQVTVKLLRGGVEQMLTLDAQ